MDFSDFFSPIDSTESHYSENSFYFHVKKNQNTFPSLDNCQIALVGLLVYSESQKIEQTANKKIREAFYQLQVGKQMDHLQIVDLGDLICLSTYEETVKAIQEVGNSLIKENILPIFLGATNDYAFAQYSIYQGLDKLISVVNINKLLNLLPEKDNKHVHNNYDIISQKPNYLFNYSHVGNQMFLVNDHETDIMDTFHFDYYRVGVVHENIEQLEPVIRDADMLVGSVNAINGQLAPGQLAPEPFGLSPEQFVQLYWYAGQNEKMTSISIFDYLEEYDAPHYPTAKIIAVSLWYFLEGFLKRKSSPNFTLSDYTIFHCLAEELAEELVFYKSNASEKWWMEVVAMRQDKIKKPYLVSCQYEDYLAAAHGNIPDIYIKTIERLG